MEDWAIEYDKTTDTAKFTYEYFIVGPNGTGFYTNEITDLFRRQKRN